MTREEAIKRIENHMEVHRIGEYPHIKISEALNMALSALREQEERDNPKPLTNADRIRAMSDEELCKLIMCTPDVPCEGNGYPEKCNCKCEECIMNWLQQPAEGE